MEPSFTDLDESIDDFRNAPFHACESALGRFLHYLDTEPLASFVRAVVPPADLRPWLAQAEGTVKSMVGSGILAWPVDRPGRVALQIELCRALASGSVSFIDFVHKYMYNGLGLSGHVDGFATKLLEPLVRDLRRLAESRPVPPVLFQAMGDLPPSGDATLDALLREACIKFKDPAPKARAEATEKLWDAWERLKSLEVEGNKRLSVAKLLDQCAPEATFRSLLEAEAKSLTDAGNTFHIRHFEVGQVQLTAPEHNDYLFHRLFALVYLLLFSRAREKGDA